MNPAPIRSIYDSADETSAWPTPDMSVLGGGRTRSPAFPSKMFGNLWPMIEDLASGSGGPVDYVAAGVLTVAASLIGNRRRATPSDEYAQWHEPCILWFAEVGDPSMNKSPCIDAATGPLRGMEWDHADEYEARLMQYETEHERAKAEQARWKEDIKLATKDGIGTPSMPAAAVLPVKPEMRRLLLQDTTPEAIQAVLGGNPTGTMCLRDELAGWFESFERYTAGGRTFWLEAFGGRPFVVDRKGAEKPLRLEFTGVSVLGGIQPERLAESVLAGADDGLAARFLWVWPDPLPYCRPTRIADRGRLDRLYRRLEALEPMRADDGQSKPVSMMLDRDAFLIFERWMAEWKETITEAASIYKSWLGKLTGVILRLSLVAELMAWADSDEVQDRTTISAHTVRAVLEFIEDYAKPTALRVFGDAARPVAERNAAIVARYIQRTNTRTVNVRALYKCKELPTLKDADLAEGAVSALIDADWLRDAPSRAGGTVGRTRKDYLVNPAVLETAR
jgi:hypothetical protein